MPASHKIFMATRLQVLNGWHGVTGLNPAVPTTKCECTLIEAGCFGKQEVHPL